MRSHKDTPFAERLQPPLAVPSAYIVDTAKAQKPTETQNEISTVCFALLRPFCGFAVWSRC